MFHIEDGSIVASRGDDAKYRVGSGIHVRRGEEPGVYYPAPPELRGTALSGALPTFTLLRDTCLERKTVLLVEDDPDCRIIYSKLLQFAGYGVIEARNGTEGVAHAREYLPSLIVMDLRLPVLDGWQTAEQIRQHPELADVPILAFTAQVVPGDDARAQGAGFARYFAKPVEPRTVLEDIQQRIGPALPS